MGAGVIDGIQPDRVGPRFFVRSGASPNRISQRHEFKH